MIIEDRHLAKNYVQALLAIQASKLTELAQQLEQLAKIITAPQNAVLKRALRSPVLSGVQKQAVLTNILSQNAVISQELQQILSLLAKKQRLYLLPVIAEILAQQLQEQAQIKSVIVTSAHPLKDQQLVTLVNILEAKLQQRVELQTKIDEQLIGGAIIEYDSYMLDCSVAGWLQKIIKVPHQTLNTNRS